MITDRALVQAAAATYDPTNKPVWTGIDGALNVFVTDGFDIPIIAIEGTHDIQGWLLDFLAVRVTDQSVVQHKLGWLHAGFLASAENIYPFVDELIGGKPYALAGHSLGAALVLLLGAMLADAGSPPNIIGAFAPPRVGDAAFVNVISTLKVSAYRYGSDVVPTVPFTLEPAFPYRQIPLTPIGPPSHDGFKDHNIANYLVAVP
jgi:predicted lipase